MRGEIRDLCRKTYRETIAGLDISPDFKRALRIHERLPAFIDNLARELSTMKFKVTKEHVINSTRGMTKMFVANVERQNRERVMSDLAKMDLRKQAESKEKLDKALDKFESLGTEDVIETKKGTTFVQAIDGDDKKTRDALNEIVEDLDS